MAVTRPAYGADRMSKMTRTLVVALIAATSLAACSKPIHVAWLDLADNAIGPDAVRALVQASWLQGLKELEGMLK